MIAGRQISRCPNAPHQWKKMARDPCRQSEPAKSTGRARDRASALPGRAPYEPRHHLLMVLILLLFFALPRGSYSAPWGYYPGGGLGLVIVVGLTLLVAGRL